MRLAYALLLSLCLAAPAWAQERVCPEHFASGQRPALLNPRLANGARALCFDAFGSLHSAVTRTALYSAEHLTADSVAAARGIPRQGEFHPEAALPAEERAELSDYARSGFDRGHLAPSGDMPTPEAQQQSFSLANMIPQAPQLNRITWEAIERAVRSLAQQRGEVFVVTGPIFRGATLQTVGRVVVPSHVFKAVMDPARRQAAAYVAENTDQGTWQPLSMAQLQAMTGMDIFPALPPRAKTVAMRLPRPAIRGRRPPQGHGVLF